MQRWYVQRGIRSLVVSGSVVIAGCGSVPRGQEPADAPPGVDAYVEPPVDAAVEPVDAPPPNDAPVAVARCDPQKPFGVPVPVATVNSPQRDQGAILVDELTMMFGSDRAGTGLYTATRTSSTSPFGTPVALTALNASGSVSGPSITADGKTLYYIRAGDIFVTTRASKAAAFAPGTAVGQINSGVDDLDPYITPDGSALYFDSARGDTQLHLYVSVRRGDGSFDAPQALTGLNTGSVDGHPVLTPDGLKIYWSSTRPDGGAQGSTDIWTATRSSTAATFGTPTRVAELSSSAGESVSWVSDDDCAVLLQTNRTGTIGAQDIFEAVRPK